MIPIKLTLSGFLSYRDPAELDFTSFDLACISGANGAGKSSLLDGITWALFGQARKRDDSLINTQSEKAEVTYTFEYEGNVYRVQRTKARGKPTILEFQIKVGEKEWKPMTERTLRDTEARIRVTLRLDYETFVNASFFLQGKADQFTQQAAGDRKRILSSILGLEVWDSYRGAAAARRKGIEVEISGLDGRLQEINSELAEGDERRARLKELNDNLKNFSQTRAVQEGALEEIRRRAASLAEQEKLVNALADQLAKSNDSLAQLEDKLQKRKEEKQSLEEALGREKETKANYKAWQDVRIELVKWDETAARFHDQERRRHTPQTEIETVRARLEVKLENLKKEREEIHSDSMELKEIKQQLAALQKENEQVEVRMAQRAELEGQLKEAIQRQTEAETENPILKEEMDKVKRRIEQLEKNKSPDCPLCGQVLTEDHREEVVAELNQDGKKMGNQYRENQTLLKNAKDRVVKLQDDIRGLNGLEEELRVYRRRMDQFNDQRERIGRQQQVWEKEGQSQLQETEQALKKDEYAVEARKELQKVDAQLKEIGYDAATHDALRKEEIEKRSSEDEMRELENAKAASDPLGREIKDIRKQIEGLKKDVKQQNKGHKAAAANLAESKADTPDLASAEVELLRLQERENKLRREEGAAEQRVAVLADQKQRKTNLEEKRENLAQQVTQIRALERAFGRDGVPAMLIEQALPQVEAKANEVLERLSGGDMSIRFITQQAYKDKKREDMKETLDIQISDSAGTRDYEMYSGGEAFRINFAIRLALSEVLAQRAGARLQTLVIDEGFGSQDEVGRQRLVEAINMVRDNFEKILVITHIDSLKDAFPQRIEVEKTARGSVVSLL